MSPPLPPLPAAFPRPGPLIYALRAVFAVGGRLAPRAAAKAAERVFCRPPRMTPRAPEADFLAHATRGTISVRHHRVSTYVWPGDGPTVVLMHGWGSYAGRWWLIGEALRAAGFRIVALDGPAHGSTPGAMASLPEFAESLAAVARRHGPVHAVVGHSLGASAIAVALHFKGLQTPRAVLIAPPAHPAAYAEQIQRFLWWSDGVQRRMIQRLERRLGHRWDDFRIPQLAAQRTEAALLFHDADDLDVPHSDGAAIAAVWPGLTFVTTHGLGHRAIMRDAAVADRIVAFLRP